MVHEGQPMNAEVAGTLKAIDYALEHLESWMEPAVREPGLGQSSVCIQYEARGVCLLFGPWNFPFNLVMKPLVAIFAAGNIAIVRPNEPAPATSAVTVAILREAFEPHEVAAFGGDASLAERLPSTARPLRRRGARVIGRPEFDEESRTIAPGVLLDVPLDSQILREEIFGPLLPYRFSTRFRELSHARSVVAPNLMIMTNSSFQGWI
ncbi:aldehyde dehydrogenase family protein [Nocardia cerradoensis]|nr:aldehyde dehydrogenase family protein [Nocardia cerradoensis]